MKNSEVSEDFGILVSLADAECLRPPSGECGYILDSRSTVPRFPKATPVNSTFLSTVQRYWRSPLASWLSYAVVILVMTWPLAGSPLSTLPMGPVDSSVVPMLNLWTIWWNADRALHAFQGYWHAPIFAPVSDSFAFSEPQPTTLLVAPVIWLTGSRVLAYNAYYWLSFLLNGVLTERLLRLQNVGRLLARSGGIAMILLPILQWQRDVIQLVPVWGILWVWIAFVKLSRESRVWHGVELGVAAATTSLMCMHYGLFAAILSAATGWIMVRRWFSPSTWRAWPLGGIVALLLAGPMILHVQLVLNSHGFTRDRSLITLLSAQPGDYTQAFGRSVIPWGQMAARQYWSMSPGWIKVGLAGLGIGLGLWRRRTRRWTLFLALTAGVAFGLSLGTNLKWGEYAPWDLLSQKIPGFSQVRSPNRFAVFVQIASVLLAVQALHLLTVWSRSRARWISLTIRSGVCLGAALVAFETWPKETKLWAVPDFESHRVWCNYLRAETPPGRAVLCLPMPSGTVVGAFEPTTNWMYFGTFHQVPLRNGYSGFFPEEETHLRGEMINPGVTPEFLDRIYESGVEFLIVDSKSQAKPPLAPLPRQGERVQLKPVWADSNGVQLYRLIPLARRTTS